MNVRVLISVLVALAIGFVIGRKSSEPGVPVVMTEPPALENLQRVLDVDVQDYYRLKNEEARYKKADEILGKMLTIFLADLGLKVSKPANAAQTPVASTAATTPPKIESAHVATAPVQSRPEQTAAVTRIPLADVRSPNDIADFLKASQLDQFEEAVKSSSPFMNRSGQLQSLIGQFVGTAQIVSKGETEQWGVEMSLNAKISAGKLTGQRSLKLSRNGKVFSDSSGNGGLDEEYRETSRDPDAIIIAAGPNTFLQAYYVRNSDQVIGSVMRKDGVSGPFKSIGFFELTRR